MCLSLIDVQKYVMDIIFVYTTHQNEFSHFFFVLSYIKNLAFWEWEKLAIHVKKDIIFTEKKNMYCIRENTKYIG